MTTFSQLPSLSGSTNGRGIAVSSTTQGSGTVLHTTQASSSAIDNITLYAVNNDSVRHLVTIEFGGTNVTSDDISQYIPANSGLIPIMVGLGLTGNGTSGSVVTAFADAANKIIIFGGVDRNQ